MLYLFLYSYSANSFQVYSIWGVGVAVVLALVALIFIQLRTGKRLQRELVELDKIKRGNVEYEFILKAMKLATWHLDPKLRTITFDNDFRDGQGNLIPPPAARLELIEDSIAPSDVQRVKTALDNLCTGKINSYHEQYRVRMPNAGGMTYWEESYATIVDRDADGLPTKIVGTTMRIDSRKEMEAALIAARNKAEESDRLKTAFIANMGHEIRTPLNAIVGFADLLPSIDNENDRLQLIREIQVNNQKLLHVIDGLVSMSKVEAEAKNLVKSQTDLVSLLRQLASKYQAFVDPQQVVLATKFPYNELMITTDVTKLTEMLEHLMDNAVKFTTKGNIMLGFELTDGEHVRIYVKDTGKGIAEADQQRVFERFVKIDEYIPGAGLGLSLVQSHAQSLDATIGLESKLGEGSNFWIILPIL